MSFLSVANRVECFNPPRVKVAHVKSIVRLEGVGVHHAVRLNLLLGDRQKRLSFGVGDNGHVDFSTPF